MIYKVISFLFIELCNFQCSSKLISWWSLYRESNGLAAAANGLAGILPKQVVTTNRELLQQQQQQQQLSTTIITSTSRPIVSPTAPSTMTTTESSSSSVSPVPSSTTPVRLIPLQADNLTVQKSMSSTDSSSTSGISSPRYRTVPKYSLPPSTYVFLANSQLSPSSVLHTPNSTHNGRRSTYQLYLTW